MAHTVDGLKGCIAGRFVKLNQQIVLLDDKGNSYDLDRVTILQGTWGDAVEGVQKLPRVELRDETGRVVVAGDRVVILHVEGNPRRPVVIGGVRPIGSAAFLARLQTDAGADQNALHVRLVARDAQGAQGGTVELDAGGGGGGTVALTTSSSVTVRAGSTVELHSGGDLQPSLLGSSFLEMLQTWNTGLSTFLAALAADATNPAIQAAAVAMQTVHTAMATEVAAAVAAQGATLLSRTVRTD